MVYLDNIIKTKACRTSHPNLDSLKRKLTSAWDEIDPEVVRATCPQVLPRLWKVIKTKGVILNNLYIF